MRVRIRYSDYVSGAYVYATLRKREDNQITPEWKKTSKAITNLITEHRKNNKKKGNKRVWEPTKLPSSKGLWESETSDMEPDCFSEESDEFDFDMKAFAYREDAEKRYGVSPRNGVKKAKFLRWCDNGVGNEENYVRYYKYYTNPFFYSSENLASDLIFNYTLHICRPSKEAEERIKKTAAKIFATRKLWWDTT